MPKPSTALAQLVIAAAAGPVAVCWKTWPWPGISVRLPWGAWAASRWHHSRPATGSLPPRSTSSGWLTPGIRASSGVLHHHGQLGEIPAGACPEVVGKDDGIRGQALAEHGVAGQGQGLPRNRLAAGVHHRAHQHHSGHEVRVPAGRVQRHAGSPWNDRSPRRTSRRRRKARHGQRLRTHPPAPGAWAWAHRRTREVKGVDVGRQGQLLVQAREVTVGNADPVQQDEGPSGCVGGGPTEE